MSGPDMPCLRMNHPVVRDVCVDEATNIGADATIASALARNGGIDPCPVTNHAGSGTGISVILFFVFNSARG